MLSFDYQIAPERQLNERSSSLTRLNSKNKFGKVKEEALLYNKLSEKNSHLPIKNLPVFMQH